MQGSIDGGYTMTLDQFLVGGVGGGLRGVYYSTVTYFNAGQTFSVTPASDQYVLLYTSGSPTITSGGETVIFWNATAHGYGSTNTFRYRTSEATPFLFPKGQGVTVTDNAGFNICYALLEED